MPDGDELGKVSFEDLSPWGQARVLHYMRHALILMDEGQESMRIALGHFEAEAAALLSAVTEALGGHVALADLTVEQRPLMNKHLDEAVRERLAGSDYVEDLLAEGVAVVVLDGDELIEIKPDGSRPHIR